MLGSQPAFPQFTLQENGPHWGFSRLCIRDHPLLLPLPVAIATILNLELLIQFSAYSNPQRSAKKTWVGGHMERRFSARSHKALLQAL